MEVLKKQIYFIISFLILMVGILNNAKAQGFDLEMQKMNLALKYIYAFYVDSVPKSKVVEGAIIGMLKELDPHSKYISKDELELLNAPLEGGFNGIGVQFNILNDTLIVVSPISGGPSEKVGIQAGDRIVEVDSVNIAGVGLKNIDVIKKLRGAKGTEVKIKVKRRGQPKLLSFTIIRDAIPIHSVESSYMVNKNIGYIKINQFSANTYKETSDAIKKLKKDGMKSLILDLRGNPGGYLHAAIKVVNEFLTKDKLIVYTKGNKSVLQNYKSTNHSDFTNGKIAVLINEGSASASEIVSGAIQDWDRGVIIGRRSFGKGLVQRGMNLPDGSIIRLTIAKYFTPSGRCIQKPYVKGDKDYDKEIYKRISHGELTNKDSINIDKSLEYKTKIIGRTVYGGGGIMPDVFVPVDTTEYSDYYRDLVAQGIVNKFVINYIDKNRKELLKKYPDFKKYKNNFHITDDIIKQITDDAKKAKIKSNIDDFYKNSLDFFKVQLKALIASRLWSTNNYFQIINPVSNEYNEAIKILSDNKLYNKYLSK